MHPDVEVPLKASSNKKVVSSFSGHETFPFRLGWLFKGVREVSIDNGIFASPHAIVKLGVGKNMVRAIRHWCLTFNLIKESGRGTYVATQLGKLLCDPDIGLDPYLEKAGTLWWLQWELGRSRSRATTWYYTFNELTRGEFTKESLRHGLWQYTTQQGERAPSQSSLDRDIDCMIRTYWAPRRQLTEDAIECPLTDINLLQGSGDRYRLNRSQQVSLPDLIFAAAVVEFTNEEIRREVTTVPVEHLLYNPGSPGRVLLLTENGCVQRLERLHNLTNGAITYDATAGLRQVLIHTRLNAHDILQQYYGGHSDDLSQCI